MYTDTIVRVIRKVNFRALEALAKTDKQLEALWNFEENGFKALLMEEIINDSINKWGVIPDIDSVFENLDKKYNLYMANCQLKACITDDNYDRTFFAIVPMAFDDIRRGLNQLPDKTAFELVRLVRRHTTKERLMKLISDRIEPDTTPTMDTIADIVKSVTDKYLDSNSIWS